MMDLDLKLPNIPKDAMPAPVLSMDEYHEFVMWCWQNVTDHEAARKEAEKLRVNVPFVFKD